MARQICVGRMHSQPWLAVVLFIVAAAVAPARAQFNGTSSGIFTNPVGPSTMVTDGVGTNVFSWGRPNEPGDQYSTLAIEGNPFSTPAETDFTVATLTYVNGVCVGGTGADGISMELSLAFSDTGGGNQSFTFPLQLINTPNTGDLDGDADYVVFPSAFSPTVFVKDGVNYTLALSGFFEPTSGGFVGVNQFHVRENATASAQIRARITQDIPIAVPEPGTLALMASCALPYAAAVFGRRWRNSSN